MVTFIIISCAVLFCTLCVLNLSKSNIYLGKTGRISIVGGEYLVTLKDVYYKTTKEKLLSLFNELMDSYCTEEAKEVSDSNEEGKLKCWIDEKKRIMMEVTRGKKTVKSVIAVIDLENAILELGS